MTVAFELPPVTDPAGYVAARDHLERRLTDEVAHGRDLEDLVERMLTALAVSHGVSVDVERLRWIPPVREGTT
ncbi:hypothetical protein [Georgenia wangjunii]|uniref:hypothetical protein n=1 Tax=Georgenia wangjunii TaxID=3117730 RepID=UPI002F262255